MAEILTQTQKLKGIEDAMQSAYTRIMVTKFTLKDNPYKTVDYSSV